MKKNTVFIILCLSLGLVGCGAEKRDTNTYQTTERDVLDNNSEENPKNDEDYKNAIYNEKIELFIQMIKENSTDDFILHVPSVLIANENYLNEMNESCKKLHDIWVEEYGEISDVNFEVVDVTNHEVDTLKNDLQNNIDSIESLNKGIRNLLEAGCNLQECMELKIDLSINGTKVSEDRELKYFFVYKIDDQWYTDSMALYKLETYESEMQEYIQKGEGIPSTFEEY